MRQRNQVRMRGLRAYLEFSHAAFVRIFRVACILILGTGIVGCAGNPFLTYYHDNLAGRPVTTIPDLIPSNTEPKIYSTANMNSDARRLLETGFVQIGYSSFNSGAASLSAATAHAKAIHASIVMVQSRFTSTNSGYIPFTTQDPSQTSTTNEQGNVTGYGGSATYSGTSTTTTPGSYRTTYIPYSVDRYDYLATYWVRIKPKPLGVRVRPLTDEMRQDLQSNKGVCVDVVLRGSPAYMADILSGDIITKLNDEPVVDAEDFTLQIRRHAGEKISIELFRKGTRSTVSVQLNALTE